MDNTLVNNRDHFFGACNSFHGFKSFFGEIFKRKDFTRIYVIKGGPGTGKSSFMKKILHRLPEGCRALAGVFRLPGGRLRMPAVARWLRDAACRGWRGGLHQRGNVAGRCPCGLWLRAVEGNLASLAQAALHPGKMAGGGCTPAMRLCSGQPGRAATALRRSGGAENMEGGEAFAGLPARRD